MTRARKIIALKGSPADQIDSHTPIWNPGTVSVQKRAIEKCLSRARDLLDADTDSGSVFPS